MNNILITGVSGFIGSGLEDFITSRIKKYRVYGVDIALKKTGSKYFKGDLKDGKFVISQLFHFFRIFEGLAFRGFRVLEFGIVSVVIIVA